MSCVISSSDVWESDTRATMCGVHSSDTWKSDAYPTMCEEKVYDEDKDEDELSSC